MLRATTAKPNAKAKVKKPNRHKQLSKIAVVTPKKNHKLNKAARGTRSSKGLLLALIGVIVTIMAVFSPAIVYKLLSPSSEKILAAHQKVEYQNVQNLHDGSLMVLDSRIIDAKQVESMRMPLQHELDDPRLLEMLYLVEGNNSLITLQKGTAKGALTSIPGLDLDFGGGSALLQSVASDQLGTRGRSFSTVNKVKNRVEEIYWSGAINKLSQQEKARYVSSHACQLNNITSCKLTSMGMDYRGELTHKQMLVLSASVHQPLTIGNAKANLKYATAICNRPDFKQAYTVDCSALTVEDFTPIVSPLSASRALQQTGIRKQSLALKDSAEAVDNSTDLFTASHELNNPIVEVVVKDEQNNTIIRSSNNEYVQSKGLSAFSAASVAKLAFLIDTDIQMPLSSVTAFATSNNTEIEKLAEEAGWTSTTLKTALANQGIGYHFMGSNLVNGASFGQVGIDTDNMHKLLNVVDNDKQSTINRTAAKAASMNGGTLQFLNASSLAVGADILVAKSGSDATINDINRDKGLYGKLIATKIQFPELDNAKYSITVRVHSESSETPLCDQCLRHTDLRQMVNSALQLAQADAELEFEKKPQEKGVDSDLPQPSEPLATPSILVFNPEDDAGQ